MATSVNLGSVHASLELDLKNFNKGLKDAQSQLKQFQNSVGDSVNSAQKTWSDGLTKISDGLNSFGKSATLALTVPLTIFAKKALDAAVTYDQVMNVIRVASGQGEEAINILTPTIEEFGTKGKFSILQVAEAVRDMVKDGLTPAQIATGQLEAAFNMATAAGEDLYESQRVLSNAMASYGVGVESAARFSDALTAALNSSQLELEDLAGTIAYIAPVAANVGISIEDLSALIAELGDRGIKGSMAGTTLRRAILQLSDPPKEAAEAMARLGLEIYDTEGNMKDIKVIIGDLSTATRDLTEEQRQMALGQIFGAYAVAGMTTLVRGGVEEFEKYQQKTTQVGLAQKQAEEASKGLSFEFQRLNSQMFLFRKMVGDELAPVVANLANKMEMLNDWFKNLTPETRKLIVQFGGFLAVIGPISVILATVIKSVLYLAKGFGILWKAVVLVKVGLVALAGVLGISVGWLVAMIAIIVAVVAGAILLYKNWDKVTAFLSKVWQEKVLPAWENFKTRVGEIFESVKTSFSNFVTSLIEFFTVTIPNALLTFVTQTIPNFIASLIDGIKNMFIQMAASFLYGIGFIAGLIIVGVPMLVESIINFFKELPAKLAQVWEDVKVAMAEAWNKIVTFFTETIPQTVENIRQWWAELKVKIAIELAQMLLNFIKWVVDTWNYLKVEVPKMITNLVEWFKALPSRVYDALVSLKDRVVQRFSEMYDELVAYKTLPAKLMEWGSNLAKSFVEGFSKLGEWIKEKVKAGFDDAKKMLKGESPPREGPFRHIDVWGVNVGRSWAEGFVSGISGFSDMLRSPALSLAQATPSAVTGNSVTNNSSPTFNVYVGMYAGSPMEKRQIAKELSDALSDYNLTEGILTS